MEEYLTTGELSERIKMAPGTIRNMVWKKEFMENTHYVKPTPRKLLFIWSAIEAWLHGASIGDPQRQDRQPGSLINI
jgi:hypothetical protein